MSSIMRTIGHLHAVSMNMSTKKFKIDENVISRALSSYCLKIIYEDTSRSQNTKIKFIQASVYS